MAGCSPSAADRHACLERLPRLRSERLSGDQEGCRCGPHQHTADLLPTDGGARVHAGFNDLERIIKALRKAASRPEAPDFAQVQRAVGYAHRGMRVAGLRARDPVLVAAGDGGKAQRVNSKGPAVRCSLAKRQAGQSDMGRDCAVERTAASSRECNVDARIAERCYLFGATC